MKVLITAPSLEESQNVSGISTLVKQIVEKADAEFFHFTAGRKDGERLNIGWVFNQIILLPRFLYLVRKSKADIVHINTALAPLSIFRDLVLTVAARGMRVPVFLHVHGGKFLTKGFGGRTFAELTKKMLRSASVVVVLSEDEKDFIGDHQPDLNLRVLRNAVPFDDVQDFKRIESLEKSIIFLGRLHEGKGLNEIIEACKILKDNGLDFTFKCCGAGEMQDFFVRKMTEILGNRFEFGGVVSGEAKWKTLAQSDIFLLPTHYEGLPMSLLEAMAVGCVPVVSEVGSIGDVVENEVNGFLIRPRDHNEIVSVLSRLLADKVDWCKLRSAARFTIKDRFDLNKYLKVLQLIYLEFANKEVGTEAMRDSEN